MSSLAANLAPKVIEENDDPLLENIERLPERKEKLHGSLPLTEDDIIELLDLDADFYRDQLNLLSKCNAYHSLRIYKR